MNYIENYETEIIAKSDIKHPDFIPGDTVRVHVRIKEGERERVQVFEGVCIARRSRGLNSAFTVRKISYGEGAERIFPLYSQRIAKIEIAPVS